MSEVRLYAVLAAGPVLAEPAPGATGVHDAFDHLPAGVYSALRTYEHERFLRLDLHMARTHRSAAAAGISDFDEPLLRRALHAVATAWPLADARVRFDVLPEPVESKNGASRLWIGLSPLAPIPEDYLRLGVHAKIARELRREHPLVKTTAFIRRRRPFPLGTREAFEHLMLDEAGRILEGTSSNFFGAAAGALRTAPVGVLEGVTRQVLLELAADLDIPVRLAAISLGQLARLDEAFLTSSSRGLVPIVGLDGQRIGSGRPGPLFERLHDAFEQYVQREARPAIETV